MPGRKLLKFAIRILKTNTVCLGMARAAALAVLEKIMRRAQVPPPQTRAHARTHVHAISTTVTQKQLT
jgi:hypothetical protein